MIKKGICLALFCLVHGSIFAASYTLDKAHSEVGFTVKHLGVSKTKGIFKNVSSSITYDAKNLGSSRLEATIDVASIDTGNEKRDEHLKSADFFDAQSFPSITFKSQKMMRDKSGKLIVSGILTIKNISKQVQLPVQLTKEIKDPYGQIRMGFETALKINRKEYNLKFDSKLADGSLIVGDEVSIEIQGEVLKTSI